MALEREMCCITHIGRVALEIKSPGPGAHILSATVSYWQLLAATGVALILKTGHSQLIRIPTIQVEPGPCGTSIRWGFSALC